MCATQDFTLNPMVFWRSAHKTDLRIAQGGSRATCLCKMLIGLHPQRKKKKSLWTMFQWQRYEPAVYVVKGNSWVKVFYVCSECFAVHVPLLP